MHVCVVAPTASTLLRNTRVHATGGAETQLRHLGKAFVERGCKTTFVIGDYGQPKAMQIDDMTVVRCPFRYYGTSWRYYLGDSLRLIRLIHDLRPDVILLKTPRSLTLSLALSTWGTSSRLVRVMAHDSDCEGTLWPLPNLAYLLGARLAHGTVFQTEWQARHATRNLGLKGRVIPNIAHGGSRSRLHVPDDKDVDCLWVGTCTAIKDPLAFLDFVSQAPEFRCTMAIAPGRDPALQELVQHRARSLPNLSYLGFVPYKDTEALFRRARLVVCTSHSEGFPNVFLQAWEHEAPVISVHIDPDDVIKTKGLGRVTGATSGLVDAVRGVLADEPGRRRMGAASRQHVLETHSPSVVVSRYLEYFATLGVGGTSRGEPGAR
jgi:glycosyltransferase involved in cell wall biosynthesis